MFLYSGSKLERDLKDLKREVKKSEYEKIIEPYQNKINELEKELYNQKEIFNGLYQACKGLINSIENNHIRIFVKEDEPKAFYEKEIELQECKFQTFTIPIKQELSEYFANQIYYYINKNKESE